jgi:hypothetical protein
MAAPTGAAAAAFRAFGAAALSSPVHDATRAAATKIKSLLGMPAS